MANNNFKDVIDGIRNSDTYENPDHWDERGLIPSDQSVIALLRKTTNDFLSKLETIYKSNASSDTKQTELSQVVDALPWDELDTEEKEFLVDTIFPAIKAAGLDPEILFS